MDREKAIKAVADFLAAVGEDVTREGLKDTPARVADVHRARRVCGDELDQHPLAAAEIAAAIPFAVFADLPQHGRVKGGAVVKV